MHLLLSIMRGKANRRRTRSRRALQDPIGVEGTGMQRTWMIALGLVACLSSSCAPEEVDYGPETLDFEGADIDEAPEKPAVSDPEAVQEPQYDGDYLKLSIQKLSLDELEDEGREDLLDAMLYPDEYTEEERAFPERVQAFDGQEVALRGYMIPSLQDKDRILSFMIVGDLLACCFGTAPRSDQWVDVTMADGESCEYFAFVPVIVKGTFRIEVIEDEAGYPAGCYRLRAVSVEREQ